MSTFKEIYDLIVNSKPLPYETWKELVDAAKLGIDALEAAAQALITPELPVIGNIVAWVVGMGFKWLAEEIIGLLPHQPSPEERDRLLELFRHGKDPLTLIKKRIDQMNEQRAASIARTITAMPAKMTPMANIKALEKTKELNKILTHPDEKHLFPLEPAYVNPAFQQQPKLHPKVAIAYYNPKKLDGIPDMAIAGYRAPSIFVNRVGFL